MLSLSVKISNLNSFAQKRQERRFFKMYRPLMKIYLYQVGENGNLKRIFESNPFVVQSLRKEILTIHLNHSSVYFSKRGLGLGVALLGFAKENGEIIKGSKSIKLAGSSRISSLYVQKTYLKFPGKDTLLSFPHDGDSKNVCNLSVSFTFQ